MSEQLSHTSPPAYGAVVTDAPQSVAPGYNSPPQSGYAPPPSGYAPPPSGYAPPPGPVPAYSGPQPGQYPAGAYPSEPPPKYEPSKQGPAGGYNPAGGYPAGYQAVAGPPTVVLAQDPSFGSVPKTIQCPYCQTLVTTGTDYKAGGLTWLASGLICLFGCWAGCCLIPFCLPDLQDVEHVCPSCNRTVGVYHRL